MIPFDQFKAAADAILYQYPGRTPEFLGALVKWLKPSCVVEVGTHIGMSAVWMARALQEIGVGRLVCVDNFCWRDQPNQERDWNRNIDACGVREVTTLLKGRSQEVEWPPHVDMAYIDGNHTYEVCGHDVNRARDLGASCIVLNDTVQCDGPRQIAFEMRAHYPSWWGFIEVPFDAGIMIALKCESKPPATQRNYDPWDVSDEQLKADWEPPPNFQG